MKINFIWNHIDKYLIYHGEKCLGFIYKNDLNQWRLKLDENIDEKYKDYLEYFRDKNWLLIRWAKEDIAKFLKSFERKYRLQND